MSFLSICPHVFRRDYFIHWFLSNFCGRKQHVLVSIVTSEVDKKFCWFMTIVVDFLWTMSIDRGKVRPENNTWTKSIYNNDPITVLGICVSCFLSNCYIPYTKPKTNDLSIRRSLSDTTRLTLPSWKRVDMRLF